MLKEEFDFYKANQDSIVAGHLGEFVIIVGKKVIGYFKTIEDAIDGSVGYEAGKFMIKQCNLKGTDVIHFYNRELFDFSKGAASESAYV